MWPQTIETRSITGTRVIYSWTIFFRNCFSLSDTRKTWMNDCGYSWVHHQSVSLMCVFDSNTTVNLQSATPAY